MKIKKIIKLKNNMYKIITDNDIIVTYDNVILENQLLFKKEIDNFLYEKILDENLFYKTYNLVFKFATKKMRTKKEIVDYINRYNLVVEQVDIILKKLKDAYLIDDLKYTKAFINDKLNLSKYGIEKIKKELVLKGVSTEIINRELGNIDEELENNKLEKLILKKINSNHKYSNNYLKQKIINEMISFGYKRDDIIEILNTNLKDDNYILEQEYNKLYNKLNIKYSGIELNKKLQQKLFVKGFTLDEINLLIKKKSGE